MDVGLVSCSGCEGKKYFIIVKGSQGFLFLLGMSDLVKHFKIYVKCLLMSILLGVSLWPTRQGCFLGSPHPMCYDPRAPVSSLLLSPVPC